MYVAAVADRRRLRLSHAIGIQYQQGFKDLLPASDLVEGMLNNADRPPVKSRVMGGGMLYEGDNRSRISTKSTSAPGSMG